MNNNILDITNMDISEDDICCSFIDYLFHEEFSEMYLEETSLDWDDLYFTVLNDNHTICEIGLYNDSVLALFHGQNICYEHPDIDRRVIIQQFINISEEF